MAGCSSCLRGWQPRGFARGWSVDHTGGSYVRVGHDAGAPRWVAGGERLCGLGREAGECGRAAQPWGRAEIPDIRVRRRGLMLLSDRGGGKQAKGVWT